MTKLGEKKIFDENKIERKKQLNELQKSLASYSHDNCQTIRNIKNIGYSKPLIDWRIVLSQDIVSDVDWSYKNASIDDGVITPHLEEILKSITEIIIDTSGSVSNTLLRNFLRECKNILKQSTIKVGCFDTKFYGFTEIKNESDIDNFKFYGGGGTDFYTAVNSFTKRANNKIIFTDGYSAIPNTKINVIWIVYGDIKINPKGGKVIYINEQMINDLMNFENKIKKQKVKFFYKTYK